MKKQIVTILILALLFGCANPIENISDKKVVNELEELASTQDYFKLKKRYELKKEHFAKQTQFILMQS